MVELYTVISPLELGTKDGWTEDIMFTTSSGEALAKATTVTGSSYYEVTLGPALPLE